MGRKVLFVPEFKKTTHKSVYLSMRYKKILFAGLAAWMSLSSFAFDLNITKRKKHLLSIKALDDGMVLDQVYLY